MTPAPSVLMIFLDGVGLAPAGPANPLSRLELPALRRLSGGALTSGVVGDPAAEGRRRADGTVLRALDACLDVEGLPQSATGQSTLFTGVNAARLVGRHVPALPGPRLRELLTSRSVFRRVAAVCAEGGGDGSPVAFANAFTRELDRRAVEGLRRVSASVVAMAAADIEFRGRRHLDRGEAVPWDVTGRYFGTPLRDLRRTADVGSAADAGSSSDSPYAVSRTDVDASRRAGRRLAGLASSHRLTLWETFLTDLAGHGRYVVDAELALTLIDGLLEGLLDALPAEVTVVLTSDHGNVEDTSVRTHTRSAVPLIAHGPDRDLFAGCESLVDVAPALLEVFGGTHAEVGAGGPGGEVG